MVDGGEAHRVSHLTEKLLEIGDYWGQKSQFSWDVVPNNRLPILQWRALHP